MQTQVQKFDYNSSEKNPREITGWAVQDKLETIQEKTKIKEGHLEWYAEKAKNQTEIKRKAIQDKRKEIKVLRIETHNSMNPHPKIIGDAMRYDRFKLCALAKKKVPDAIEWVDLESIDMEKACDNLIYIRQKKEEKLEEAQQKLALLTSVLEEENSKYHKQELQKIQYLQNEIQKQVTKEDTAFFVMKQYQAISKILENDMIHFHNILEELGSDIKLQHEELKSFNIIAEEEKMARREAEKLYKQTETELAEKAEEPERKLMMLKFEASSFTEYEMNAKRSIPDFFDTEATDESEKAAVRTRTMLTMYEDSYKLLKDAMMATDIKQISVVFMAQEWTKEHLTQEIKKHKEKIIVQMDQYDLLEETFLEISDALDEKRKKMKDKEEETLNLVKKKEEEIINAQTSLNWLGTLLANLKSDLNRLLNEFLQSELAMPEIREEPFTDIEELLDVCIKRIQNLINDIQDLIQHLQDTEEKETFEEFLDSKAENLSVEMRYVNYPSVKQIQKPIPLHETEEDEDNIIREMMKKVAEKYSRKMSAKKKKTRSTFI